MTWSRNFSSLKEFNEGSQCPDNCDEDTYDAAYAMAKAGLKGSPLAEAKADKKHLTHEDNRAQAAQAQIRISLFGHGGDGPSSYGATISEI